MTSPALTVIAPDLSAHTSSTGTSYYIQQRTALFARVSLACSTGGLVVSAVADVLKGHGGRIFGAIYVCFAVAILLQAGLWIYTRTRPRPLPIIHLIEIVAVADGLIAASFGFRLATPELLTNAIEAVRSHANFMSATDPGVVRVLFEFCGLLMSLLVATQILVVRAALVPSTLKHSLVMAAVVGVPICFFVGVGWPAILPPNFTIEPNDRGFLVTFGLSWWLFTGAACGVIARIVHRLQSEVQIAKRLGQYELGEKIGQGGMGIVYRARHAMMKRPVAVKLLPAEAAGQDAVTRFEREVQLTSQLSHPNTVVIHDYGRTHEGVFYYVMEYIDGATLEQVSIAAGPMPAGRVVHILEMVAGALGEAHERGLVHRDIKPANILLGPRGGEPDVAKVLDFGLVRAVRTESDVTTPGVMMGTPLFMSPEAIRNPDRVDGRSDLYSLGALSYFLLSGHYVFEGESALDVCGQHMHATPKPISELVPGLDPELATIVMRCLAKDPAERFPSAHDLCEALARCPSRGEWTAATAAAWWSQHQTLLHPKDPAQTYVTGEIQQLGKAPTSRASKPA